MDGDGKYQRVSGTNVGGGTYWGLGRLLTKCKKFVLLLPFVDSLSEICLNFFFQDLHLLQF